MARNHLKQLQDPCNGPLTHPVYSGFTRGNLVRLRGAFQVGKSAGETSGFFLWNPAGNYVYNYGAADPTTGITTPAAVRGPHDGYISANFDTFRVVSACITVIPNSSELNRAGLAYAGTMSGGLINEGTTFTIANASSLLPSVTRSPAGGIEALWLPSQSDEIFQPRNSVAAPTALHEGSTALCFGFTGAEAAKGYTVVCTATYEFLQPSTSGVVQQPSVPSKNTTNDVLREFWRENGGTIKTITVEMLPIVLSALKTAFA